MGGQNSGVQVCPIKNERSEDVAIEVLFSPWQDNTIGTGTLSLDDWGTLSGSIINDGIGAMSDASNPPDSWPDTFPIDVLLEIYFDDNTYFAIGYTPIDEFVIIQNGTWTGSFTSWGWPETTGLTNSYWLNEDGKLATPVNNLFTAITENAPYP